MIEETGSIVELKGKDVAVVLCQKSSMCEHCAAEGSCHIGDDSSSKLVEVHNPLGAGIGDRVKIATSTRTFLQSSFILYIVPLIALVIGAVSGQLLGEWLASGLDPNLLAALFGTSFMTGSFLIIRLMSRSLAKEAYMPVIVEVLDDGSY